MFIFCLTDGQLERLRSCRCNKTSFVYQNFKKRVFLFERAINFFQFFDAKLRKILFHCLQCTSLLLLYFVQVGKRSKEFAQPFHAKHNKSLVRFRLNIFTRARSSPALETGEGNIGERF